MAKVIAGAFWRAATTAPEGLRLFGSPSLCASSQPHTNTALTPQELSSGGWVLENVRICRATCVGISFSCHQDFAHSQAEVMQEAAGM